MQVINPRTAKAVSRHQIAEGLVFIGPDCRAVAEACDAEPGFISATFKSFANSGLCVAIAECEQAA